jgi:TolB-like protein
MTGSERARLLRCLAGYIEIQAARIRLHATMVETAEKMQRFADVWQAGIDRDVAEHPDLAELNVQLDSYYG